MLYIHGILHVLRTPTIIITEYPLSSACPAQLVAKRHHHMPRYLRFGATAGPDTTLIAAKSAHDHFLHLVFPFLPCPATFSFYSFALSSRIQHCLCRRHAFVHSVYTNTTTGSPYPVLFSRIFWIQFAGSDKGFRVSTRQQCRSCSDYGS